MADLQEALIDVFKLLNKNQKKTIYNALLEADEYSMSEHKEKKMEHLKQLKEKYFEEKEDAKKKKEQGVDLTDDEKDLLDRTYVSVSRYITKTYLKHHFFIVDINQEVEVMEDGPLKLEYTYHYDEDKEDEEYHDKMRVLVNNLKENRKALNDFQINKLTKVGELDDFYPNKRFTEPFFLTKIKNKEGLETIQDVKVTSPKYEVEDEDGRKKERKYLKIDMHIGDFEVGDKVIILTSFSFPIPTFKKKLPEDKINFKYSSAFTRIIIQEEIYGSSNSILLPKLYKLTPKNPTGSIQRGKRGAKIKYSLYYKQYIWESYYQNEFFTKYKLIVTKDGA